MIAVTAVLFLFGTSAFAGPLHPLATEIVISKHKHDLGSRVEYLPAAKESPFVSNFIQKGTNVFFKPQIMLSSAPMPAQVHNLMSTHDDCKTAIPVMAPAIIEEPLRVVEKEIIASPVSEIKEIIEINPAPAMPPVQVLKPSVIVEKPLFPYSTGEFVSQEVELAHLEVPEVSLLSPYVPQMIVDQHHTATLIEEIKPEVAVEVVEVSKVVPPAPQLPPLELPNLPLMIEEVPVLHDIPCEHPVISEEFSESAVVIPAAPLLPALEFPKLPLVIEETKVVEDTPIITEVVEEIKPMIIPEAPVLPPMTIPELPVKVVEEISAEPCAPTIVEEVIKIEEPLLKPQAQIIIEKPAHVEMIETVLKPIPAAPVLPPLEFPKVVVGEHKEIITSALETIPCETEKIVAPAFQPIYVESHPVLVETHKPLEAYSYQNQNVLSDLVVSPSFIENKHCEDEVVVEHIVPKMKKAFDVPLQYLTPLSYKVLK